MLIAVKILNGYRDIKNNNFTGL